MKVNTGPLIEGPALTIISQPLAACPSLGTKLKFDGFRCGSGPLAAFSRRLQPFKSTLPLLPVDPMEVDQPSRAASPTLSPGVVQITNQLANLQLEEPIDLSPLVGMMARLSLEDQSTSTSATSSSSSGQPTSVPAAAVTAKTEKKPVTTAPSRPSTSATPKPPRSATPANPPQRPAGQLSLPAVPPVHQPSPLFASARKTLAQGTDSQPSASSSSGQSSAPAPASAPKKTTQLATIGAIDPRLSAILDKLEVQEAESKTEKPKPKPWIPKRKAKPEPKPQPRPEPKPKPQPEPEPIPEPAPEAAELDEPTFEDLEAQLAVEELAMAKEANPVPKYKGNDRKIAPLKKT
jgi:hypothetical protein